MISFSNLILNSSISFSPQFCGTEIEFPHTNAHFAKGFVTKNESHEFNFLNLEEAKPIGIINNFGGFTDGDRCVFLANHFKAKKIILLGMDFGTRIGKYSKNKVDNRAIKIAKLHRGKKLLEWFALKSKSELYSTTKINGFRNVNLRSIDNIIKGN